MRSRAGGQTPPANGRWADLQDEKWRPFWEAYAPYYRRICHSPVYQEFIADTITRTEIRQGDLCLDLGCGPGYFASAMHQAGGRVRAVDYSDAMLNAAEEHFQEYRRSNPSASRELSLHHEDVHEFLRFTPSVSVDVVLASLCLAYTSDPEGLVREIYRVLRPSGRFVMGNPVPDPRFDRILWRSSWSALRYLPYAIQLLRYSYKIRNLERRGEFHFFSDSETLDLLSSAGFQKSDIDISRSFADTVLLTRAVKTRAIGS